MCPTLLLNAGYQNGIGVNDDSGWQVTFLPPAFAIILAIFVPSIDYH
jgi:hypothetical protein